MRLAVRAGAVTVLVLVSLSAAAVAEAATPTAVVDPVGAATSVQSMLDAIVGPGHAVVRIAATEDSAQTVVTRTAYGPAVPTSSIVASALGSTGTSTSTSTTDAVSSATSSAVTPSG